MMQQALRARLLNDPTIAALVGTRVDWDKRPQGNGLPCLTLEMVTENRDSHMGGLQNTRQPRVRVHCWTAKAADAHNLAEYVIAAIAPPADQGVVRFLRSFPQIYSAGPEDTETGQVHRQIVDLRLHHLPIP